MRILFITDYLPYPLVSGDRIRVYNLIRRVAGQHQVSLAGFVQTPGEANGASNLREFCHRVETLNLPRRNKLARLAGWLRLASQGIPFDFEFLESAELAGKIRGLASAENYDIVQIEHSRMARYLEALPPAARARSVLVFHNIASSQYSRISNIARTAARGLRTHAYSRMLSRWEPRYAERFDRCITVSEADRDLLLKANPRLHIDVVPNGVDARRYQPLTVQPTQPAVLFLGTMSYAPNADGAVWFCRHVLPRLRCMLAGIQVWIVGASPPPEVVQLDGDGVHVTGRVEDVLPYYERSMVTVVPLRAGGGTRLKILEAMALGRPVISTSVGCEGLDVVDGRHLLIADSPATFAELTVNVLTNPTLYRRITSEARELVVARYDWDVIADTLMQVYGKLAGRIDQVLPLRRGLMAC